MNFNFEKEQVKDFCVLTISGNLLDQSQARNLLQEVDEMVSEGVKKFIINLADSEYMTSSGLNILINILTRARKTGGEAIICCVPKKIQDLLVTTKLNNVFTVAKNLTEAKKIIQKEHN